eukprot:scaffold768_cov174-Ochromonas_danica.AAC.9
MNTLPLSIRRTTLSSGGKLRRCLFSHHAAQQEKATSSMFNKLCFLGGGQMTEAILGALQMKKIQEMSHITVVDPSKSRLEALQSKLGVQTTSDANKGLEGADMVVLAVKPQNVNDLAASLTTSPPKLLLSIVAGLSVSDMQRLFHTEHVIRTMPNTPAMVLEGITVWMPTKNIPLDLKEKARALLQSFGEEIEVSDEHYVDMATAVSGSGPGVSISPRLCLLILSCTDIAHY